LPGNLLLLPALAALALVAYLPSLGGGFLWDDDRFVTGNELLRSAAGLGRIWLEPSSFPQYYPLTVTSFWLEYRLWGPDPAPYRLANLLLHLAAALLVWAVLRRLRVPWPLAGAALFLLHPVQVETVAWISERKNLLSAVLGLGSLLLYLEPEEGGGARRPLAYATSFLLFLLGLLAKTTLCTLPAVIAVLLWWRRGRIGGGDLLRLVPFFAAGVGLGLVTVAMETSVAGAAGTPWELSPAQRLLIAGRALWFYAGKLLWPVGLAFSYPRWEVDPGSLRQVLFPLAALATLALLWLGRGRLGRGPLAGVLIYAGALFPALGFFDVYPMRYTFVADHYQYLPGLGLLALLPALAARFLPHGRVPPRWLAPAVLLPLALITWRQAHAYRDAETLWRATLRRNPASWMAHVNLGVALADKGRNEDAAASFRRALELDPDNGKALFGLGRLALAEGRTAQAVDLLQRSRRAIPEFVPGLFTLAGALAAAGEPEGARALYTEVLRRRPGDVKARHNLGILAAGRGQWEEALRHFAEAARLEPANARRHAMVGLALDNLGRSGEAEAARRRARDLDPSLPLLRGAGAEDAAAPRR
jgi:tetratricopeptide (TPR) repeat protein